MSFAPDESAATLFAERGWLQGAFLGGVAYGVDLTLFSMCFFLLIVQVKHNKKNRTSLRILLLYISVMFTLVTLFTGSLAKFTELAFIDDRNFPGGPNAFEEDEFSIPIDELGNVSFVIANWLADAMIVWRCAVIYRGCRFPIWAVMLFPCLMFLSSFVTGLLWLLQISGSSPFGKEGGINYTIPYLSLSLALNICVTVAIVSRLLIYRRRITGVLGSEHGTHYTSVAAMIIESAAIYSFYSLAFLVPFGLNNPISTVFLQSLSQVQIAATFLIVFRVAQGKGWMSNTANRVLTTQTGNSIPLFHLQGSSRSGTGLSAPSSITVTSTPRKHTSELGQISTNMEEFTVQKLGS